MPSYGLLPVGFVPKPLSVARDELDQVYKATFGNQLGTEPDGSIPDDSVAGQHIGIHAEREAILWELIQIVAGAFDPANADASALDTVCSLTGTVRLPARSSVGFVIATGDPGTALDAGKLVSIPVIGTTFQTDDPVVLAAAAAWATSTAYASGALVTNGGAPARIYQAQTTGVSSGIGTGPSGTGSSIVDNTVTWSYVGDGTAAIEAAITALETGPFAALTGQITEIGSPVTGWLGVRNMADIDIGAYVEKDAVLRIRRINELPGRGNATLDAIRAHILAVGKDTANAVKDCIVLENTTMVVSVDGIPPKAFEAIVLGGIDQDIFQAIWDTKPAGIESHGTESGTVTDDSGTSHTVEFTRPTEKDIWIEVDLTYDAAKYPVDGDDQAVAAILAQLVPENGYTFGKNVTTWGIGSGLDSVPGIIDVTAIRLGLAPAPVGTVTIPIGIREIAIFDSARILITSVAGTP